MRSRPVGSFVTSLTLATALLIRPALAEPAPDIQFIWFGGNDCPTCVAWRALELPKLQQSEAFKGVRFSYVPKVIKSSIPPAFFLPPEVVPLKEQLDVASGGRTGSPKAALVLNGQLYDFFSGWRSADDILSMIQALQTGQRYPFKRCLRFSTDSRKCEVTGSRSTRPAPPT